MNWLTSVLPNDMVQALGWTLIHSLWQAGLLALPIAAVFSLLPRLPARAKARVSYIAVLLIVILAGFTYRGQILGTQTVTLPIQSETGLTLAAGDVPPAVAGGKGLSLVSLNQILTEQMPVIALLWLLGALTALLRLSRGVMQLHRIRRLDHKPVSSGLQNRLDIMTKRFGLRRPIRLFGSSLIGSPVVFGELRPIILFPLALIGSVSVDQIEALLAHELAHIKRHDYLLNLLMRVIRALFFFNPGLLWLAGLWESEREISCDQMATAMGVRPQCLAEALLEVRLEQRAWLRLTPAAFGQGSLRVRIQRIFGDPVRHQTGLITGLPFLFLFLVAGFWLWSAPLGAGNGSVRGDESAQAVPETVAVPSLSTADDPDRQKMKAMVEEMEQLRSRILTLREKKAGKARDAELAGLEKKLTDLAGELLAVLPPSPPIPPAPRVPAAPTVAEAKPGQAASPQPPAKAEMWTMRQQDRLLDKLETELDRQNEVLDRIREKIDLQSEREIQKKERALAELRERDLRQLELAHEQIQRDIQRVEEQVSKERLQAVREMEGEQRRMEAEQRELEKKLALEESRYKGLEEQLTAYLLKHKLIKKSGDFRLEIRAKRVFLKGKDLQEPHCSAIIKMVADVLGDMETRTDRRIVIQR